MRSGKWTRFLLDFWSKNASIQVFLQHSRPTFTRIFSDFFFLFTRGHVIIKTYQNHNPSNIQLRLPTRTWHHSYGHVAKQNIKKTFFQPNSNLFCLKLMAGTKINQLLDINAKVMSVVIIWFHKGEKLFFVIVFLFGHDFNWIYAIVKIRSSLVKRNQIRPMVIGPRDVWLCVARWKEKAVRNRTSFNNLIRKTTKKIEQWRLGKQFQPNLIDKFWLSLMLLFNFLSHYSFPGGVWPFKKYFVFLFLHDSLGLHINKITICLAEARCNLGPLFSTNWGVIKWSELQTDSQPEKSESRLEFEMNLID